MGRSNGYRPKAAVRKEVLALRAKLAECRDYEWVKAGMIMEHITGLLGHSGGPMNGKIEPRVCRHCKYYGHTRQWCPKYKADVQAREEREIAELLEEDRCLFEKFKDVVRVPYDPTKSGQALTFDEIAQPYTLSPYCGPIVGVRGEEHHGKWTFDEDGYVVAR